MSVTINRPLPKPIGNRKKGYDRRVLAFAPQLGELQRRGFISAGQIADSLRSIGMLTPRGKPYAESVIFNMLKRGKELGLPLIVRTRVEAAAARPNSPRRPRGV